MHIKTVVVFLIKKGMLKKEALFVIFLKTMNKKINCTMELQAYIN